MSDLMALLAIGGFFAAAWLYTLACDRV